MASHGELWVDIGQWQPTGAGEGGDAEEENNQNHIPFTATLSPKPRTLYDLWNEYQHGIGDQKAAKDFTAAERGQVTYN